MKRSTCWSGMALPLMGVCFSAVLSTAAWAEEPGESWPQWRGVNRDGLSQSTGLSADWAATAPRLEWMTEGFGSGYASISIADGKIFTTGNVEGAQAVVAASQETGQVLWRTPITEGVPQHDYEGARSTPTFDDGRLYVVASSGRIVCLDAEKGTVIWARDFSDWGGRMMSGWGFSESPLVDGNLVICTPGGDRGAVVALNKRTGANVWAAVVPDQIGDNKNHGGTDLRPGAAYSSVVISEAAGVKQYVQLLGQGLVGIRAKDGEYLWGYEDVANNVANIPTPIAIDDMVFCSTGYGTGSALLDLKKRGNRIVATERYFLDARTFQNHHGGVILANGHLYAGHRHGEGFPICVELETGKVIWGGDFRGPGGGSAAIAMADGHLVFRYQDGTVAWIEATPQEYRLKGEFKPEYQERESWAHPVIVDGRLYLREQDKLMCYDLRVQ